MAAGSTFNFLCADPTGPFNVTLAGSITGSGGGTISLAQGNYYPQAPGGVAADATLDFPSGMVQVGDATFAADGNTLTNTGFLNFTSSTGNGAINMINQGTITNSGSSDLPIGSFVNDTTGILDLETDGGLAYGGGGGTGLTNTGVIRKSAGTGVSVLTTPFFNDGGALDIESGSLAFQEHNFGYIAGPITIATGSQLDFQTSNGVYVQGTLSSTGGGTVTMSSGWFDGPNSNFGENSSATGSLDFAPGTLTFAGGFIDDSGSGNLVNTGTADFAASGGPLGNMYNSGTMNFAGGQFDVEKGTEIENLPGGVINFQAPVGLVTEAINCRFDNQGTIVVDAGNSTMDLATPYPYDQYTFAPSFTNEGTVEVASGTLIYPSVSLASGDAIPAGAGYTVDAGATLSTEVPTSITTNDGTVILRGLGAEFPAIAPLGANNGTFAVQSGAIFSTTGNLTNTGTLSVGGSLTVNGNFVESATSSTPPVLDFPVAAPANSNAAPDFTVTGSTTLAGNLTAEFSNGFAAAAGSVYNVANFSSSATGAFASTAGVGPNFTVAVNPKSIVLDSSGAGATDLAVTSVSAPATFTPGQAGAITWSVANNGATASGDWTDSVYLSADGTVNAGDLLLGRVTHTGGLSGGASYTGALTATFPAAAGTFQVVVLVDSTLAVTETSRANNVGASSPIVSSIPALTLGGQVTGALSAGEDLLYTLVIPGGTDVRVSAVLAAPALTDLEISRGAIPSSASAQFRVPLGATSDTLATTITDPQPGTYYILLQGQSAAGSGQSFTLSAAAVAFGAFGVSPTTVGQGNVSLVISGAGFTAGSSVELRDGSSFVSPVTVTASNESTLLANFNLAGTPVGTYSLEVTDGSNRATLSNAITVQAATKTLAPVQFSLDAPSLVRFGHIYDLLVSYTNPNNVDVTAPVFQLSQPNAEFELISGDQGANINPDTTYSDGSIELVACDQEGSAGVLPPDYTGVYDVRFTAIVNISDSALDVTLNVNGGGSTFDLASLAQLGPNGVSQVTAEILAAHVDGLSALPTDPTIGPFAYDLNPDLSVSSSALNSYLDNVATELSMGGLYTPNVASLINTALSAADDFGAVTQRQTAGAFGQGIPDPLLYQILPSSTRTYVDVVMPTGTEQFLENGSKYTAASPLDTATLTTQADGTLRLFEQDGSFYQFNASDYLAYFQTPGGLQTKFNYDASHNVTSVVAPGNQTTTYSYNGSGLVTSSTDPFGDVTTYGYTVDLNASLDGDAWLLTTITTPAGTTTITYSPSQTYQSSGIFLYYTRSPALAYLPTSITLPDGSGEKFTYDAFGRLKETTLLDGSDPVTEDYDATGLGVTTSFADGSTETELFGPGGILLRATDATGETTAFNYGPNLLLSSILAPSAAQTSVTYNSQNEFSGGVSPTGTGATLTYDSEGRVIGLTDGNGNTVTEAYDSNSNLTALSFPDGTRTQYAYNSAGEIDQIIGRDGAVTSFTLNSNGQPTQVSYSGGISFSYTYDAHGDVLTSTDADGTTTYSYNAAQEITNIAYPGGQSVSYQYNSKGLVTEESDQSGLLESYTYDADARLSEVLDGSGDVLVAYSYDDLDRVALESFENGTKTVYGYDANGNVASITNLAVGGTVSSSLTYTYDARGNPLSSTDQSGNVTSYAYDLSGQLTQVSSPGGRTIEYAYDADGNRTSVVDAAGTETATYAVNNLNQYTSVGSTTYTYDKDGNLLTMTNGSGTTTYTYNPNGQLGTSTGPAGTFSYSYNGLNQLDSYTINGVRTNLLLDAAGNVIAAFNASGNLIANYQYGLGLISQQAPGGSSSFYDFDLTGNTTAITNSAGATVNTYSYLPFGEKLTSTGPTGNLFTFSGAAGVLDLGDGFYQTTYRTYSPNLGRFIQPDPAGFAGGDINLYRYVFNSPTGSSDPTGLSLTPGGVPFQEYLDTAKAVFGETVQAAEEIAAAVPEAAAVALKGEVKTQIDTLVADGSAEAATGGAITPAIPFITLGTEIVGNWEIAHREYQIIIRVGDTIFKHSVFLRMPIRYVGALLGVVIADEAASADPLNPTVPVKTFADDLADDPDIRDDYLDWITKWHAYIRLINGLDPNEIVGPAGGGANQYITAKEPLSYTVFFENEPTASAPAQDVTVTTTLDPDVDLSTFQLLSIGWGSEVLDVPAGLTSYSNRVSYVQPNTGQTILVDVSAALDLGTRTLTWTFTTLDPATLDSPSDALAGFLPPDNSSGQGTGYVSYAVDPVAGLASGKVISAAASVVFDENPAIATDTWTNTIDAGPPPTSAVTALPSTTTTPSFTVAWSGSDSAGPGISRYNIYVSDDGASYSLWQAATAATTAIYTGQVGHTYQFYSVAANDLGLLQPTPLSAQATITVVPPPPPPPPAGRHDDQGPGGLEQETPGDGSHHHLQWCR